MVTRNARVRTPRKAKVWARAGITLSLGTGNSIYSPIDLLDALRTDVGINSTQMLTCMRILGFIRLNENGNDAVTPVNAQVHLGIAWLDRNIVNASDGDSQIPDPGETGNREALWLWKGTLLGEEPTSSTITGRTADPIDTAYMRLDVRQMRKQPTVSHELALVVQTPSTLESALNVDLELDILLALP